MFVINNNKLKKKIVYSKKDQWAYDSPDGNIRGVENALPTFNPLKDPFPLKGSSPKSPLKGPEDMTLEESHI